DLTLVHPINQDTLISTLKIRFDNDIYYTRISDIALVAINSYKSSFTADYVTEYKDTAEHSLPPHVFQLTNQAYFHMRRTGIDQSILLSGEPNSGKTEQEHLILQHLINLSSFKKEKRSLPLLEARQIIEFFGHCRTTANPNASRVEKYTEIQFNARGKMIGCRLKTYLLDKNLLRCTSPGDHLFHVFLAVFHCSAQDRHLWRVLDPSQFAYLHRMSQTMLVFPDAEQHYTNFKAACRALGWGKRQYLKIMQVVAAILHLGNLQFVDDVQQETAHAKNIDILTLCADLLGVDARALENVLTYKTQWVKNDLTTILLNAHQAAEQRDCLAMTIYGRLFDWLVDAMNTKLNNDSAAHSTLGVFPISHHQSDGTFHSFCLNYATERLQQVFLRRIYETEPIEYSREGIDGPEPVNQSACLDLLVRPRLGLVDIIQAHSTRRFPNRTDSLWEILAKQHQQSDLFRVVNEPSRSFVIQHYHGAVAYHPQQFLEDNREVMNSDFVGLFRASLDSPGSQNAFVARLFEDQTLNTGMYPQRSSSTRVKHSTTNEASRQENEGTVLGQLQTTVDDLTRSMESTCVWSVLCIQPNDSNTPNVFDTARVRHQLRAHGVTSLTERLVQNYTIGFEHEVFCQRYTDALQCIGIKGPYRTQCETAAVMLGWSTSQVAIGHSKIFLSESVWRHLEDGVRTLEKDQQRQNKSSLSYPAIRRDMSADALSRVSYSSGDLLTSLSEDSAVDRRSPPNHPQLSRQLEPLSDRTDNQSFASEETAIPTDSNPQDDAEKNVLSGLHDVLPLGGMDANAGLGVAGTGGNGNGETGNGSSPQEAEQVSVVRKRWVWFVWAMTWWVPSPCLQWCGRMKRADVRLAWREKLTLCMIIFLMSGFIIWFLVFFGKLVCPHQDVFSQSELQAHNTKKSAYVAIHGEVFDLTKFAPHHWASDVISTQSVLAYAGTDVSDLFPVQVSSLCEGVNGALSDWISMDFHVNLTDTNAKYHDFRAWSGDFRPDWYFEKMVYLRRNYKIGTMGFVSKDVVLQATNPVSLGGMRATRNWAILNNNVYDLTYYIMGSRRIQVPDGQPMPANVDLNFMSDTVVNLFRQKSGTDITNYWNVLPLDPDVRQRQEVCLRNLFYVGTVDQRNSIRCIFSEYLLLIVTIFLCLVIVFKFLAALQFGTMREPENHDKFIVCQVPCYTEDEESLKKTIDSIAALKYDDKRKLLFIICDGMIIGGGNDRPTPRIVLDILGVDSTIDPEALSFLSIGEGQKQHNMAKVYSGLYECSGHVVPYIVISKVGKPSERQKPGNRGKRDSQLILMRFLNKVHFNAPMTPMELEIFHQIKNVIGVNPAFYEFVLMVDADTEVLPDGLNRMVSSFVHDSKIIGLCGETVLSNEKDTWVTMIQVYEYFISHYMIKAFESLFGSVTCLPGCFCMYRVRSPSKNQPLLISNQVIEDYQINKVDTLHMKNLLHLGEDRYLTTLILKHFPNYKTKFIPDAQCATNAPDQWSVLLSQRRRWINSTIHNLGELVFLPQLCGFCCFSMRFVVMLDLVSTLVQPAIVGYLIYLIYSLVTSTDGVPVMSMITIAGVYGLQAVIFILHRKWEHMIWMIVSIFAIPVFSFYIPIYAYWHFDDFSWGNTRVVVGDKGVVVVVAADEGTFDPSSIPTLSWEKYEEGLF
ncbi:glycosyltransferase family 2 protein, partial [Phycomyces blakesleeanus NRRL 1555(-)]